MADGKIAYLRKLRAINRTQEYSNEKFVDMNNNPHVPPYNQVFFDYKPSKVVDNNGNQVSGSSEQTFTLQGGSAGSNVYKYSGTSKPSGYNYIVAQGNKCNSTLYFETGNGTTYYTTSGSNYYVSTDNATHTFRQLFYHDDDGFHSAGSGYWHRCSESMRTLYTRGSNITVKEWDEDTYGKLYYAGTAYYTSGAYYTAGGRVTYIPSEATAYIYRASKPEQYELVPADCETTKLSVLAKGDKVQDG